MSKFKGCLEGEKFDFIAVDNFTIDVVRKASVFFLSHYHADHFCGLRRDNSEKEQVSNIFKTNPKKILYCSDITRRLFISDDNDRIPENQIVGLCVGESIVVSSPEQHGRNSILVTVTPISSGHILGAVMFLFEHEDDRALFTGDFRIYPDDIPKLNALHYRNKDVKPITHLYLDTTFGYSDFPKFPLRSEVTLKMVEMISDWFRSGYVVHIDLPYTFAYERLLFDLSKGLNTKIAIDPGVYHTCYAYIPELDDVTCPAYEDTDKDKHKIHAFVQTAFDHCMFCRKYRNYKTIRPCALSFNRNVQQDIIYTERFSGCDFVRVAYSAHCSFEELKAFVKYLKPKKISTIVSHKAPQLLKVKEQIFSLVENTVEDVTSLNNCSQNSKLNQSLLQFSYRSSDESADEYEGLPMDSPPR